MKEEMSLSRQIAVVRKRLEYLTELQDLAEKGLLTLEDNWIVAKITSYYSLAYDHDSRIPSDNKSSYFIVVPKEMGPEVGCELFLDETVFTARGKRWQLGGCHIGFPSKEEAIKRFLDGYKEEIFPDLQYG